MAQIDLDLKMHRWPELLVDNVNISMISGTFVTEFRS